MQLQRIDNFPVAPSISRITQLPIAELSESLSIRAFCLVYRFHCRGRLPKRQCCRVAYLYTKHWTSEMELELINRGSIVSCTTCFNQTIEGGVMAFDPTTKMLILSILFVPKKNSAITTTTNTHIRRTQKLSGNTGCHCPDDPASQWSCEYNPILCSRISLIPSNRFI